MRAILRQSALLILFCLGLYVLAYGLSLFYMPPKNEPVDLWSKGLRLALDKQNFFSILSTDMCRLQRSNKPKLIVLGSSNSGAGFRPEQLQPFFPAYEVANLSVPGATMEDIRQVLEILQILLPPDICDKSVFVVGIWYHSMWGRKINNVNAALVKSGLYKWKGEKVCTIVPPDKMDLLVRVLRPFSFLQRSLRKFTKKNWLQNIVDFPKRYLNWPVVDSVDYSNLLRPDTCNRWSREEKRDKMKFHERLCNLRDDRGFQELITICELVQRHGGELVLVDMPLPEWYQKESSYHLEYQERKRPYLEKALCYPSVRYINLLDDKELSDDNTYWDTTHPCTCWMESWSRALRDHWVHNGDPVESEPPKGR